MKDFPVFTCPGPCKKQLKLKAMTLSVTDESPDEPVYMEFYSECPTCNLEVTICQDRVESA